MEPSQSSPPTGPPQPQSGTDCQSVLPAGSQTFPIVGIGASAGGLEAFSELLKSLPADTGMALVLIQHLDPQHESALVELLSRVSKFAVNEVKDGTAVELNRVYVIPPNTN